MAPLLRRNGLDMQKLHLTAAVRKSRLSFLFFFSCELELFVIRDLTGSPDQLKDPLLNYELSEHVLHLFSCNEVLLRRYAGLCFK